MQLFKNSTAISGLQKAGEDQGSNSNKTLGFFEESRGEYGWTIASKSAAVSSKHRSNTICVIGIKYLVLLTKFVF